MPTANERSLGELFSDLSRDVSTLVHEEMALAKAEMQATAKTASKDAILLAAGAALAYGGLLALLATIVIVLYSLGVALWLSALLVGIIACCAGGLLAMQAMDSLRKLDVLPRQTVETMKENVKWAKEQIA